MSSIRRPLDFTTIAVACLVGGVAVSSVAHASGEQDDEPRSVLTIDVDACPGSADGAAISVGYDDLVDGHTPQQVTERLADQSGELWSSTELHQVDGDYFDVHNFPATAEIPITDSSVFTYSLTISYEDGVTQTQSANLAIADHCDTASPTTVPPTTTPDAARFDLNESGFDCVGESSTGVIITLLYVDTADGHRAVEYSQQLAAGGEVVNEMSGLAGPPIGEGDSLEMAAPFEGFFPVDRLEVTTYTFTMWVRYDDGVVVSDSESFDVAGLCGSETPTTTQPSGTLPQTGSSMTWGIAALGGVLSAAGGVLLVAGGRRRTA